MIILPKEVAEAIEHLKTHHGGNDTILAGVLGNANGSCIITLREYFSINGIDDLLRALVNGYEVEETPEDKVRAYYKNLKESCNWSATGAIENVFEMLNIKIEGVNA